MKKMKKSRLTLHRETIQRLDDAFGGVLGGDVEPPSSQICCPPDNQWNNLKIGAPLGTK